MLNVFNASFTCFTFSLLVILFRPQYVCESPDKVPWVTSVHGERVDLSQGQPLWIFGTEPNERKLECRAACRQFSMFPQLGPVASQTFWLFTAEVKSAGLQNNNTSFPLRIPVRDAANSQTAVSYYKPGRPQPANFILPDILFVAGMNWARIAVSLWHHPWDFFMGDKKW